MDNELCFKTATELRSLLHNREISALELLSAHLTWIDQVNPEVNAIVTLVPEHARSLAEEIDRRFSRGEDCGLLGGLPIAHKDLLDTRGIRTTYGSRIHADHVPTTNSSEVQTLLNEGVVTLGKTNTPEWGAGSQTFNEVFGVTRNPYDSSKTCGGSSGGAAVALAARMLPVADGSDLGGSLRNPASFCNVVGFRTSAGRVPSVAANGFFNLSVAGPMARNVDDCALMLAAMNRRVDQAPVYLPFNERERNSLVNSNLDRDFQGVRIAVSDDFGGQLPVEEEVAEVIRRSRAVFEDLGCKTVADCPDFSGADDAFKTLRAWNVAETRRNSLKTHRALIKDTVIWNAEQGLELTGQDIYRAQERMTQVFQKAQQFLAEHEFLVLPVSQVVPFDVTTEYPDQVAGIKMQSYIDWMQSCYFVSVTGLPAISIPAGFSRDGLPIGLQIIGRHQQEVAVLELAKAFETATRYSEKLPEVVTRHV